MSKIQFQHTYNNIISLENLLEAWKEFVKRKRNRKDIQEFERNLMSNIISLHNNLSNMTYKHLVYEFFKIYDPKERDIHKASVRDRLLHHALHRKLYLFFDRTFISDSFSCRLDKGTHRAIDRFRRFFYKASQNNTKTVHVLKCDIKKFFASIDQDILMNILNKYIFDKDILKLVSKIVSSFHLSETGVGLPLGNLTSQLLVNIYMNEFDQFIKHKIKVKYYIRYADDFVILSKSKDWLESLIPKIQLFLSEKLKLRLHPNKVSIKTLSSGIDFLGWVHFPYHRVLRTSTKKRMLRNIENNPRPATIASYIGLLKHGNSYKLKKQILR